MRGWTSLLLLLFAVNLFLPSVAAQVPSTHSQPVPWGIHLAYGADPQTMMTVMWLQPRESEALIEGTNSDLVVQYGTSTSYGLVAHVQPRPAHYYESATPYLAFLQGLRPGTTYHYRVGSASMGWSSDATFTTAPASSDEFVVTLYGDQGTGRGGINDPVNFFTTPPDHPTRQVVAGTLAQKPDFHLHLGDLSYDGWDEWQGIIEPLSSRIPYMVTPGNHDIDEERNIKEYDARMVMPAAAGTYHYAFTYGHARFISLDSENWCVRGFRTFHPGAGVYYGCGKDWIPNEVQLKFLRDELAQAREDPSIRWVIPFFHRPVVSDGAHGGHADLRGLWGPLFDQYKPELVLQGHDHLYERSHPLVNHMRAPIGTTFIVSGGAGHGLYDFQNQTPPEWEAARAKSYHYVVLRFRGDTVVGTAYDLAGRVLDEFTLTSQADTWNMDGAPVPVQRAMPAPSLLASLASVAMLLAWQRRR